MTSINRHKIRLNQAIKTTILVAGFMSLISQPAWSTSEENMLFHFTDVSHFTKWNINNDTVMGGVSQSQVSIDGQQNLLLFTGSVSLENNGGFASTESILTSQITTASLLTLVVKGDGKTYQIRLKTPSLSNGEAYVANFTTRVDTITQHAFTAADFTVSFRGRSVANAPELHFEDIDRIGFLVAQKQQGPFAIELHSIQFDR
ncbi:CIA30 family protein [Shewanella polaris]|uniref:CIA30 family protein n=1 Tax=Shewanella polaris TaxID=2588449 RepID=A0A4Y5YIE5_9GAMM|nr:CIA30 family protein [Shewanella polaris]QDE32484.1 CIA30 family protein [Shewanella polaris]